MGLKKTEAEKKAAAAQRKKNRQAVAGAAKKAWNWAFNKKQAQERKAKKKTNKEALRLGIKKGDKTPADKGGLSVKQRVTAAQRTETFKADRKIKDKGQKSYNKGKDKKDWVGSAYERRQKDADTAMREAARKRHEAWKKARAEKKKAKQVKKSMKATQKDLDKKVKRKNQISHSM